MKLKGIFAAVATPFINGDIDVEAYTSYIEWLIGEGIDGIVVCGSTGESSMLSFKEHIELINITKDIVRNRITIIANCGANSTSEAVYLTQEAEKLGVDAVLSVVPYYVKPTQQGLIEHYTAIHNASNVPIIIYNVPSRTVTDASVDTIVELSKLERIIGIKEASSDMEKVAEIVAKTPDNFSVLSGNDSTFLPFLSVGGDGVISVIANVIPARFSALYKAVEENDLRKAIGLNSELLALNKALSSESNPIPVKYALYRIGKMRNELRLPLTPLRAENMEIMDKALADLGVV
ncbi:4-hydroxy-tetrahydrodipicolinate synthase [uncultured Ruminococcus sp.]|uniref:4-hydroxy-tetrahydrodipicolinate synthase n=1 Tax=uncultured Ruminococcus sp. TaxID=165186 RepID=UPI0025E82A12|nr:4-hydroxy-tetrahydrodipicolinate synthase [uncultured Ruminococcus sp.]